jgi:hypothetical protein
MQRANELHTAQASFIESGIGVSANIIERVQSCLRPADDDFPATNGTHHHGRFGKFGERNVNALIVVHG